MEEDLDSGLQRTCPAIAVSRARLEHGAKSSALSMLPPQLKQPRYCYTTTVS